MKKRKDECLFCSSRKCGTRIVRLIEPKYDEIACDKHVLELEKHSDKVLGTHNGILRNHISSYKVKRGEILDCMVEQNYR